MAERPCLVPDTSVIFKWYVTERERNIAQARSLQDNFFQNKLDLLAPNVLSYELANLLRITVTEGRLAPAEAARAYADFEASLIPLVNTDTWVQEALNMALVHQISVFDALFLLVGLRGNSVVVTDDERMARAGTAAGCTVVRLMEYRSP